jgi:hypothetical protein
MKTALQKALCTIAPNISIRTFWEHDMDCLDIREDCDGFDDENPEDWQAWQSEVRVTAIHNGEEISSSAYLGGTWEKAGDDPRVSNPEISGYEPQMTAEALGELLHACKGNAQLASEIELAIAHISSPATTAK